MSTSRAVPIHVTRAQVAVMLRRIPADKFEQARALILKFWEVKRRATRANPGWASEGIVQGLRLRLLDELTVLVEGGEQ